MFVSPNIGQVAIVSLLPSVDVADHCKDTTCGDTYQSNTFLSASLMRSQSTSKRYYIRMGPISVADLIAKLLRAALARAARSYGSLHWP